MSTQKVVELPNGYYGDFTKGRPLFNANIFVGLPDTDPEIPGNQLQVTLALEDGTFVPVSQPINTGSGGYVSHNGSAATMYVEGNYSIKVLNNLGAQIYYFENVFNKPAPTDDIASFVDTVAEMDALNPAIGEIIVTNGYTTAGDSGDNTYEIVAGGTGTEDGGSFINLSNGLQAKGLFPNGRIVVDQFGADGVGDDHTAITNAITYAATLSNNDEGNSVVISGAGKEYLTNSTVVLGGAEGLILRDIRITGTIINLPVVDIASPNCFMINCIIDGNKVSEGISVTGARDRIIHCDVFHFANYGIKFEGSSGDSVATYCYVQQWFNGDAEFANEANWTATGIWFTRADDTVSNCIVRWCGILILNDTTAASCEVADSHLYAGGSGILITDKILIESHASLTINDCYLDNGRVELFSPVALFNGNRVLINPASSNVPHVIGVYANGQTRPFQLHGSNWLIESLAVTEGTVPLFAFLDNGPESWGGDFTNIEAAMASRDLSVSTARTHIVPSNSTTDVVKYVSAQASTTGMKIELIDGDTVTAPSIRSNGDDVILQGNKAQLSNNNANGVIMDSDDTFHPFTGSATDLGRAGNLWAEVFAANGVINTSDADLKQDIEPIPDEVLDAWATVNYVQFRWIDAVEEKGDAARFHTGVIAQQIRDAFIAKGLDATRYGLLCYDEWAEESEDVMTDPGDENTPPTIETRVHPAGSQWSIRPSECMFMEAALMRRELNLLKS